MAIDTRKPDSSSDDEAAHSESDKALLAARDDPKSIRKKAAMSAPLEQVMKEVAPETANAGGMARVERRITMLEKAFAEVVERHEKSLRERVDALAAVGERLHGLSHRVG